jgi:hypothetical protein
MTDCRFAIQVLSGSEVIDVVKQGSVAADGLTADTAATLSTRLRLLIRKPHNHSDLRGGIPSAGRPVG